MYTIASFLLSFIMMFTPVEKDHIRENVNTVPERQNACEIFTKEEVANLLEIPVSALSVEDVWTNKKRSVCYYYSTETERKLYIRLAWKSDAAIQNGVLENQYKGYLKEGGKDLVYSELSPGPEQVLIGTGEDQVGQKMVVARKRFGNEAEAQIEMLSADRDDIAATLTDMLSRIK